MLVYGTQVKSTELSSAAFAFAGKGNNYSICFASKMGIANVFLASLGGKNHTQYGEGAPLFTEQCDNLAIGTHFFLFWLLPSGVFLFFFSLMWFILERCLMHEHRGLFPTKWQSS